WPDLSELLKRPSNDSGKDRVDRPEPSIDLLKVQSFTPIPEFILKQMETIQIKSFMGTFPEINRVWMTVDSRLFLWNYDAGPAAPSSHAIDMYDDQEQIIVSVGLVKPVKDVFLAEIEYLLVVATPIEIILLGLTFNDTGTASRGQLTIYKTDLTIASDNVCMNTIVGTEDGRIFMNGDNGDVYELHYQVSALSDERSTFERPLARHSAAAKSRKAEETWFTRKIQKVNHSGGVLRLMAPDALKNVSFIKGGTVVNSYFSLVTHFLAFRIGAAVTDAKIIVMDKIRRRLYVITQNTIEVVDVSDGKFKVVTSVPQLLETAHAIAEGSLYDRDFGILAAYPVLPSESKIIQLVAVTTTGHRLYFSDSRAQESSGALTLQLLYVRAPPPRTLSPISYGFASDKFYKSLYAEGLLFLATSHATDKARILSIGANVGAVAKSAGKLWVEQISQAEIEGKIYDISESTPAAPKIFDGRSVDGPGEILNELATQFERPARSFGILTNA
ncbi:Nucleoporin, Nup133/Nup155-like protein, partial [Blyttiomyces helicus]